MINIKPDRLSAEQLSNALKILNNSGRFGQHLAVLAAMMRYTTIKRSVAREGRALNLRAIQRADRCFAAIRRAA